MNRPPQTNHEAILAAVALVSELVELRRRRREGGLDGPLRADLEVWQERRRAWRVAVQQAHDDGTPMRLVELQQSFALSEPELDLLLVALAPHVDPEFVDRLGRAHETLFFRGVDADLALGLLHPTTEAQFRARALLAPGAPLIREGLLQLEPIDSRLNPHEVELRPSDAVASYLLERSALAGALGRFCELATPRHRWDQVIVPDDPKRLLHELVTGEPLVRPRLDAWGFREVLPRGRGLVVLLTGPPGTGKTALAHGLASLVGARLLVVRSSHLVSLREPIGPLLCDVLRVARLEGAVVLLDDCEALLAHRDARMLAMLEALDGNEGLVVLTTNLAPEIDFAVDRRIQCRVDLEIPSPLLREQIWEVHLPPEAPLGDDIDVPRLAASYEISGGAIRNAVLVGLARMAARGDERLGMATLREAAEAQLSGRFDDLARATRAPGSLEQLVLPPEPRARLAEILDACRFHDDVMGRWGFGRRLASGRGICVLFDGPPGTGKTFTAELLAGELRLPLYRVHIPNIVSKWVGETERNLSEIFVRARASRAVLLFDEADSLFGRRTSETRSATDRYANMEVNLLLQEIERYDGITLLTTNLVGNLDDALQRRIQFRLSFPFPDEVERGAIWRVLVPPEAPLAADVSFESLGARFELAGGHIKNAVLRAAYRARARGGPIAQEDLVEAALGECEAQGKVVRR